MKTTYRSIEDLMLVKLTENLTNKSNCKPYASKSNCRPYSSKSEEKEASNSFASCKNYLRIKYKTDSHRGSL